MKRSHCPTALQEFWNFKEEITIEDGIILKLDRIIIPTSLRDLSEISRGGRGVENMGGLQFFETFKRESYEKKNDRKRGRVTRN